MLFRYRKQIYLYVVSVQKMLMAGKLSILVERTPEKARKYE
jgi:hypothetical protein